MTNQAALTKLGSTSYGTVVRVPQLFTESGDADLWLQNFSAEEVVDVLCIVEYLRVWMMRKDDDFMTSVLIQVHRAIRRKYRTDVKSFKTIAQGLGRVVSPDRVRRGALLVATEFK